MRKPETIEYLYLDFDGFVRRVCIEKGGAENDAMSMLLLFKLMGLSMPIYSKPVVWPTVA